MSSAACALVTQAPPSFTQVDLGKLGFTYIDGVTNEVTLRVTRPGTIVFVGSDAVPFSDGTSYTLNVILPATSPNIGDSIALTAVFPVAVTTFASDDITYVFHDSTGNRATILGTSSFLHSAQVLYYLGGGAWSGLASNGD